MLKFIKALLITGLLSLCSSTNIQVACAQEKRTQTPFDFDTFTDLMAPIPDKTQLRLQGLDENLMKLWKQERLQVAREGHYLSGDFNGDGVQDDALLLEKDDADIPMVKDVWMAITTKQGGERKQLFYAPLIGAHSAIEFSFDKNTNEFIIDTGKRIVRKESDTPLLGGETSERSSSTVKEIFHVVWDAKSQKFALKTAEVEKSKRKHKK